MNLNFMHYINISLVSHVLLILILSFAHPHKDSGTDVFNVNIVPLPDIQKTLTPDINKPVIRKKKPVLQRRRRKPHPSDEKPDSLYGRGSGHPGKESGSSDNSALSAPEGHKETIPSTEETTGAAHEKDSFALAPHSYLFDRRTIEKYAGKGPPPKKGLSFDTLDFKHRGYMRMLKERIEDVWQYPREAARQGLSGELYIKFSIRNDGNLSEVELVRTSGHRDLDEAAMKALRKAGPFWPLPEDWEKDTLEITGHFIYIFGNTLAL